MGNQLCLNNNIQKYSNPRKKIVVTECRNKPAKSIIKKNGRRRRLLFSPAFIWQFRALNIWTSLLKKSWKQREKKKRSLIYVYTEYVPVCVHVSERANPNLGVMRQYQRDRIRGER